MENNYEQKLKIEQYEEYINEHRRLVSKSFQLVKEDLKNILTPKELDQVVSLIIDHDNSKWSRNEFGAYRRSFFPVDEKEKEDTKQEFDYAWNHHYKHNPHHWQYWIHFKSYEKLVLNCKDNHKKVKASLVVLKMPTIYLVEMLCDWLAMSLKFKNNPLEWYEKNKNEIWLHEETEKKLISLLPFFEDAYEEYILENKDNV